MADTRPRLLERLALLARPPSPAARLWLAVGGAVASAGVLAGGLVLVTVATLLGGSCGEDWRWTGLVVAAAVAGLAVLVGLAVCGMSRRLHAGGMGHWATAIVVVTVVAWGVAGVSLLLPTGACS